MKMKKVRIPKHISISIFEDSGVILDLKKSNYYGLNDSASEFINALKNFGCVEKALKETALLYGISVNKIEEDMKELVDLLLQMEMLEII